MLGCWDVGMGCWDVGMLGCSDQGAGSGTNGLALNGSRCHNGSCKETKFEKASLNHYEIYQLTSPIIKRRSICVYTTISVAVLLQQQQPLCGK